jgi:PIN domain nuclease of toxin-antitoxin system
LIALDTHALFWWATDAAKLSRGARRAIADTDGIGIPAIVFWEIALLVRHERIDVGMPVVDWTRRVLSLSKVVALPLTPEIAVRAEDLEMHGDPADRFIVATARHHGCALVTKDRTIRRTGLTPVVW